MKIEGAPKKQSPEEIQSTDDSFFLEEMNVIKNFKATDAYSPSNGNAFEYVKRSISDLINTYNPANEENKIVILDAIKVFKEKSSEFADYTKMTEHLSSLNQPKKVLNDYNFLYSKAAEAGIITDKADIESQLKEIGDSNPWATMNLNDALRKLG
jgi:hypothetical protein